MPALHCTRRRDGVNTLRIIDPMSDLGAPWTPAALWFRAGTLETCNLTACCSHRGATSDLSSLGRSALIDDACGHSFTSPYHSSLALNRGDFPEGSSCHHFDPIRYVVRGASHPVIRLRQGYAATCPSSPGLRRDVSVFAKATPRQVIATVARPRRDRQEHAGYYTIDITNCKYTQLCDIVSQITVELWNRESEK